MKWVTWENIGVDRMGSGWLIHHFIDSQAEFKFIAVGSKPSSDEGEPFDIPGVRLSHRGGHCTFHTIVTEYKLKDPLLLQIASMIDEADIAQEVSIEPVAHGLDFICRGIRLVSADDQIAMERGRLIYDALYAQLGAEVAK